MSADLAFCSVDPPFGRTGAVDAAVVLDDDESGVDVDRRGGFAGTAGCCATLECDLELVSSANRTAGTRTCSGPAEGFESTESALLCPCNSL